MKITALLLAGLFFTQVTPTIQAFHSNIDELREEVAPSTGVSIPIKWEGFLEKLEMTGVVELPLLDERLSKVRGYGLSVEEQSLFQYSTKTIRIDPEAQTFLLFVFEALGFSNNNTLLDGHAHMLENRSSPVGYAKYDSVKILELTSEQQDLVEDVALNSHVPCCNNPVLVPDSGYGFASLGLIEFLVYNGITRDDIFKTLLIFNVYWFPNQYIDIAVFLEEQGISWKQVNSTQIMGYSYSSLEAYLTIKEYLVESNLFDPLSEEYLQDPILNYRQPMLILFGTILSGSTLTLIWFLRKRWSSNKEKVESNHTE